MTQAETNSFETNFAEVGGLMMAYHDAGEGPAVLFLHGYTFDKSMWRAQIQAVVASGSRAIAPDLRGLGETKSSDEIATMADMARDAAALLDELRIEQAVVCGLSMGGYVAFEFVHLFPARVSGLVLAGTRAPADNEQERAGREQQALTILRAGMTPIAIATVSKLVAARTLTERKDVVKFVRGMIGRSNPKGAAAAQRGMAARRDYTNDLPQIKVPTLIIVGREDPIRPVADAEFMHQRIPHSRLEVFADAAHMTNLEQPEKFERILLDFLNDRVSEARP